MNLRTSSLTYLGAVLLSLSVPGQGIADGSNEFPVLVDSWDDFIVSYKGQNLSLRDIFRRQNVTPPEGKSFFYKVKRQKTSKHQSCKGRCFSEERKKDMTCYCDNACKTFGDCCLDFYSRCIQSSSNALLQDKECGDVNSYLWSGVIMRSTCSSHENQSTKDCHTLTVQQLNMTLQKELAVSAKNVTYRSIACAKCNYEENASFWALSISCKSTTGNPPAPNITALTKFLKEHEDCSWKYVPTHNLTSHYRSCVVKDARCATNKSNILPIVRELCALYSMVFTVDGKRSYRNPHCALCNQEGWLIPQKSNSPGISNVDPPYTPPLRILLDVSPNVKFTTESREKSQPTINTEAPRFQVFNMSSQVLNCTSTGINNCTCQALILANNQSSRASLSSNKTLVTLTSSRISYDNDFLRLQGNDVSNLCPTAQPGPLDALTKYENDNLVLVHFTFAAMILSIVSLCFLLAVYLSFKELRNLPGRCVINLSGALLCYQAFFLSAKKSTEVPILCQAVAILIHFFALSAFSWMAVMAFDTASTFTPTVADTSRQPSDTRKIFIKYCILGWGLPAVIVGFCIVLDLTGTFHVGYGNFLFCWISDNTALTVVMVTPVSAALIFNVICFAKSVYAIRHLQQAAALAASNSSKASLILICIKLTTVMGLTWILQLAAKWRHTEFLQYPSAVLNSMQGLFITSCFVTTKKVRGLFKERFSNRRSRSVEPQTNSARDQPTVGITDVERAEDATIVPREQGRTNSQRR